MTIVGMYHIMSLLTITRLFWWNVRVGERVGWVEWEEINKNYN
jgi:hypothetical protein